MLEIVVTGIEQQIEDVSLSHARNFLPFLGTLSLFVASAALCTVIPRYEPATDSLSTTAALALCVLVAIPLFGIEDQGMGGCFKSYIEPTMIMLPFNISSEISHTLALRGLDDPDFRQPVLESRHRPARGKISPAERLVHRRRTSAQGCGWSVI